MQLELTLALVKPYVLKIPCAVQAIRGIILENGFYVVKSKRVMLSKTEVENFYAEHAGKFFFNRLTSFMTSGPVDAYILTRIGAIDEWRKLMGPTKVFQAQFDSPNSIRGKYGLTDTRNATHGSDSLDSCLREVSILFPEFEASKWLKTEEYYFRIGKVELDTDEFVHTPKKLM